MKKPITYTSSGVNIELGDDVSKILYNAAKQTWNNRKGKLGELIVPFDDFSGVRAIDVSGLPSGTLMNMGFDGVGTKMELAERINDHRTIAFDLFAMVCDDAVVRGAEPVLIGSILDVNSLGESNSSFIDQVQQLAEGYISAAKNANVAIVNGEVAELGSRIGGFGAFNYNWGAAVVWFANKNRMFTGLEIKKGDYLIGLQETGFRSNGLSLLRKIMTTVHGEDWHAHTYNGESLAKLALEPSKIYCNAVVEMFGGFQDQPKAEIHGVAHITGGGIPGKLGRVLKPSNLGAVISEPYLPTKLMLHCQEKGNVPDEEAYRTWNMGQGMIIISPEPDKVMAVAESHNLESKVIGQIESRPGIRIMNKGAYSKNQYLHFK
jgi:phosphoribosylformylglycinamidine cyclo-ligase